MRLIGSVKGQRFKQSITMAGPGFSRVSGALSVTVDCTPVNGGNPGGCAQATFCAVMLAGLVRQLFRLSLQDK